MKQSRVLSDLIFKKEKKIVDVVLFLESVGALCWSYAENAYIEATKHMQDWLFQYRNHFGKIPKSFRYKDRGQSGKKFREMCPFWEMSILRGKCLFYFGSH